MPHSGYTPSLTIEGRIATITLRRPELANRLETQDLNTLLEHFTQVEQNRDILVLCLKAEGKHFCSGYNIGSFNDAATSEPTVTFADVANRLEKLRPITVAVIHGGLYGGATDLALACDFRLGTPATQMFVPAARLGLHFYQGGMERMVSRLGLNIAKRVLLLCETFKAPAMLDCGFLTHYLDDQTALEARASSLCQELSAMAPLALTNMKKHLNAIGHGGINAAEFAADMAQADASEDLQEGARAWQEKRPAVFKGR